MFELFIDWLDGCIMEPNAIKGRDWRKQLTMVCLHYVLIHSEMFTARQWRLYIVLKKSIQTARTHKTGHVSRVLFRRRCWSAVGPLTNNLTALEHLQRTHDLLCISLKSWWFIWNPWCRGAGLHLWEQSGCPHSQHFCRYKVQHFLSTTPNINPSFIKALPTLQRAHAIGHDLNEQRGLQCQ